MIRNTESPWKSMENGASRRIDSEITHELFWIKDEQGRFGFYLQSSEKFPSVIKNIKLKGVVLIKRNTLEYGELFLILNKKSDWEIFLSLCNDILATCSIYHANKDMINAVEARLKRWQLFLMQHTVLNMSTELQMGLFSELLCIKNVLIPSKGIENTIRAWGGPDKDKQDFNFAESLIETKSYITSKGARISVSSAHQLFADNKPLFIISYGLTISKQGQSINEILLDFDILINKESSETQLLFEKKLIDYGYIPGLSDENILKFIVDSVRIFEVTDNFPKILPNQIPPEIVKISYALDLELCREYERQLTAIFLK